MIKKLIKIIKTIETTESIKKIISEPITIKINISKSNFKNIYEFLQLMKKDRSKIKNAAL